MVNVMFEDFTAILDISSGLIYIFIFWGATELMLGALDHIRKTLRR